MRTFNDYMRAVNRTLEAEIGFDSTHIADFDCLSAFEDGVPAVDCAVDAIYNDGTFVPLFEAEEIHGEF